MGQDNSGCGVESGSPASREMAAARRLYECSSELSGAAETPERDSAEHRPEPRRCGGEFEKPYVVALAGANVTATTRRSPFTSTEPELGVRLYPFTGPTRKGWVPSGALNAISDSPDERVS